MAVITRTTLDFVMNGVGALIREDESRFARWRDGVRGKPGGAVKNDVDVV